MSPFKLLIVGDDPDLLALLAPPSGLSRHHVSTARTLPAALAAIAAGTFDVALVDLDLGREAGLDAIRAIRAGGGDAEVVVLAGTSPAAAAVASPELEPFAFVHKPFDAGHLTAVVQRAGEHREVMRSNRRLVWEQALLNEVGNELRNLLAPEQIVDRVLRRLMKGMCVDAGGARLLNPLTGVYDLRVVAAPALTWGAFTAGVPPVPRPSDRVLATRSPVIVADFHDGLDEATRAILPARSALSVPMLAGEELVGALSLGSSEPHRFGPDDQRLLSTVANHVAVAVQNARLHGYIRAGKQEWEATFDAISDAIAVYDRRGRLLRGNTGLASLLARPLTSMRGLTCDEIGLCAAPFPDCSVGRGNAQACVHEEVTRGEKIFSVATCPVLDVSDGAAIVQIAKNVTPEIQSARRLRQMSDELAATNGRLMATVDRLKATQAQLLQAEKLSAIGQLVAGVAHELNNPLTSVIGYAQLLQEEVRGLPETSLPRPPDELSRDLRRIAEESERAARIVRNLLAFARRQSAARAEEDIAEVMNRVLALRAYEFRINAVELRSDFEPGLAPVLGDGGQLQQALLNLVLNAEQAMRSCSERRIHVATRRVPEADAIELCIGDTGHGIPDENLRRIFDPFFTTRQVGEGTGLGLSICYGIIRDHGGQIAVESRVGQGTTFKLLLPHRIAGQPLRALVAHRDPTERDYVVAALTGWGHLVTAAESAEDARARLDGGGFDIAFLDRSLDGGRGGWPDGRTAAGRRTRIIAMTEAAEEGGVAPPFELSALRAALRGLTKECV